MVMEMEIGRWRGEMVMAMMERRVGHKDVCVWKHKGVFFSLR